MRNITRREFLKGSAAFGAYACCAAALGIGAPRLVYGQVGGGNRNMIALFNLFGGCDDLNSFCIPFSSGAYYDIRPTIGIPENQILMVNNTFGFHPALQNLHALYNEGSVAVIHKVGEPVGTRSHFTSQDIMSLGVGSVRSGESRGWIGRVGDEYFSQKQYNTFALGVGRKIDFVSNRITNPAIVVPSLPGYQLQSDTRSGMSNDSILQRDVASALYNTEKDTTGDIRDSARRSTQGVHRDIEHIQNIVSSNPPAIQYPATRAASYLRDVGILARSGVGAKLAYGGMGGWDNHANQGAGTGTQSNLLAQFDGAIGAFASDMKSSNSWNNVAVCVFTEFGRTKRQNTSLGTDHGWASTILMIGGSVRGGVYGEVPTAAELRESRNWIVPSLDYRNPFGEMLSWSGLSPEPIFTEAYSRESLNVFRA